MIHKMKYSILIALAIGFMVVITCFASACQPTPTREVIVSMGSFEEKVARSTIQFIRRTMPLYTIRYDIHGLSDVLQYI